MTETINLLVLLKIVSRFSLGIKDVAMVKFRSFELLLGNGVDHVVTMPASTGVFINAIIYSTSRTAR